MMPIMAIHNSPRPSIMNIIEHNHTMLNNAVISENKASIIRALLTCYLVFMYTKEHYILSFSG